MHPGLLEGSANTKFGEVERRLSGCVHETLRYKLGVYLVRVVTFGLNVRLDLSGEATTESLRTLSTKLLLEILGKGARTVAVWVIRGDEGAGAFPGVRGGSGEPSEVLRNIARLSQELRLKV